MKAVVLYDFVPHRHPFTEGLQRASKWGVEERGGDFPRRVTKLSKLLVLFPLTFWIPLKFLFEIGQFEKVFCWQQNYGIILGLLIRAFRLNVSADIYLLTFIATERRRKGLAARLINYAVGCKNIRKVVCYNVAELELYSKVYPALQGKLVTTLLSEEFPKAEAFPTADEGYYFAAGRSNRDYEFLFRYFQKDTSRVLHVISNSVNSARETDNVKVFTNTFHDDYFRQMSKCRAVIVAFEDETISSGQMVFLHALQLGKPVIATRSDCLKGYLIQGQNGIEIEKDEEELGIALARLDDECFALAMSKKQIQDHQDRFGFESMGARVFLIASN